ncbi:MAG: ethR 6 [Aeromicrobium sp.]|nr:ethR 6 [Aeromicrobium sp.]
MASKGDKTRQRILSVVAEMLATHTFEEISIAEITRRAVVTRPGFYFYFPTKGAAVATLMEDLFAEFTDVAEVWYDHGDSGEQQALGEGMARTVDLWRTHATVMHGMVQAASADPAAREIWRSWIAAFTARAIPTITADAGSQLDRSEVPVERLADTLVGLTFDAMQRDVRSIVESSQPTEHLVETLTYVWSRALYGSA